MGPSGQGPNPPAVNGKKPKPDPTGDATIPPHPLLWGPNLGENPGRDTQRQVQVAAPVSQERLRDARDSEKGGETGLLRGRRPLPFADGTFMTHRLSFNDVRIPLKKQ